MKVQNSVVILSNQSKRSDLTGKINLYEIDNFSREKYCDISKPFSTLTISDSSPLTAFCWFPSDLRFCISSSRSLKSDSSSSSRAFKLRNSETALKSQLPRKKQAKNPLSLEPFFSSSSLNTSSSFEFDEANFQPRVFFFVRIQLPLPFVYIGCRLL